MSTAAELSAAYAEECRRYPTFAERAAARRPRSLVWDEQADGISLTWRVEYFYRPGCTGAPPTHYHGATPDDPPEVEIVGIHLDAIDGISYAGARTEGMRLLNVARENLALEMLGLVKGESDEQEIERVRNRILQAEGVA